MNVYFPKKSTKRLDAILADVKGKGSQKLANVIAGEIAVGNDNDRLAGLDRYGNPLVPVKPRKGKYKGATGPPLAPFGAGSRVVANFRSQARKRGGKWQIVAGWESVVSKSGVPFLPFHDQGVKSAPGRKPKATGGLVHRFIGRLKRAVGLSYFLPPRPIFGISPRTWQRIRMRVKDWKNGVMNPR